MKVQQLGVLGLDDEAEAYVLPAQLLALPAWFVVALHLGYHSHSVFNVAISYGRCKGKIGIDSG